MSATAITRHYTRAWGPLLERVQVPGTMASFDPSFRVELRRIEARNVWVYASVGMSNDDERGRIEAHLFCGERRDDECAFAVSVLAYFHLTGESLGLHHTVNFGQPVYAKGELDHGYLSLPYYDGEAFEWQCIDKRHVRHLWLMPISQAEREYKRSHDAEALEQLFERERLDYANPSRKSVL